MTSKKKAESTLWKKSQTLSSNPKNKITLFTTIWTNFPETSTPSKNKIANSNEKSNKQTKSTNKRETC